MTDDRDICERLEDTSYDGAFAMRRDAARLIRQLRYYTTRLEADLVAADLEMESLRKHVSKQQLDIATLGQEVGRLREALQNILDVYGDDLPGKMARAAIGEEKK
jgi:predicted  nucleic acid-binding Zn-ribbon protein